MNSDNVVVGDSSLTNSLTPPWDSENSIEIFRDGHYTKLTHGLTFYQLFEPVASTSSSSTYEPRLIRSLSEKQSPIKKTKLVLCMHGITWWSISFHRVVQPLIEQGYTVLLFDFYGRGRSDAPEIQYTLDSFLGQAIDLIDFLNIESVYLIGYSMGGAVATHFAATHPQRIIKLILMSPAIIPVPIPLAAKIVTWPYVGKILFKMVGAKTMIHKIDTERFKNDVSDPSLIDSKIIDDLVTKVKWQILEKPGFLDSFHSTLYCIPFSNGLLHLLPNIPSNLSISIILGTKDVVIPYTSATTLFKNHLPQANVVSLECGHAFTVEVPIQLSDVLIEQLSQ